MYYQHEDLLHPASHLLRHPAYSVQRPEQVLPRPPVDHFVSLHEALFILKSDVMDGTTTTSTSPSSLPTYLHDLPSSMQMRLAGSHRQLPLPGNELIRDSVGLEVDPVRRIYSTGDLDLQRMRINSFQHGHRSESPPGSESMGVEHLNKVGRYTAEERKERIERYRSKRNQRNFNKKIKYACRKTLADSRPRVRGRFARNDEAGESSGCSWASTTGGQEEEEEEEDWVNFLDAFPTNLVP